METPGRYLGGTVIADSRSTRRGPHEVAHSVGELLRQRGCFRSQDTGGINDKNFRKLSPSALSSIWRTWSDDAAVPFASRTTEERSVARAIFRAPPTDRIYKVDSPARHRRIELCARCRTGRREASKYSHKPTFVRVRALCKRQYGRSNCEGSNAALCCALAAAQ